ncbi:uncharacterized protein [Ptychodera flava]|uniref:uncharacterized protein n=1 Tax=Ptychodera flava TaxID=63121 RepID=UPI00396A9D45
MVQEYTNRHNPSSDTVVHLAKQEILRFLLDGGKWKEHDTVCEAGSGIQGFGKTDEVNNFLFGREVNTIKCAGQLVLPDRNQQRHKTITSIQGISIPGQQLLDFLKEQQTNLDVDDIHMANGKYINYKGVIARSGETVKVGSSVLYNNNENKVEIGIVNSIHDVKLENMAWISMVAVNDYTAQREYDAIFDCQILHKGTTIKLLPPQNVLQMVSVAHDCKGGNCNLRLVNKKFKVERSVIRRIKSAFKCNLNHNVFLLNRFRFTHHKRTFGID